MADNPIQGYPPFAILLFYNEYGERGNGDRTKNSIKMEKTAGFQP